MSINDEISSASFAARASSSARRSLRETSVVVLISTSFGGIARIRA